MRGAWLLSLKHALYHRPQTVILTFCLAVPIFVPLATAILIEVYETDLTARAASTPLVAGARGNRFDLTLAALYFRQREMDTIPFGKLDELQRAVRGIAVPIHSRFTARGWPVVGTSPEYFEQRGLRAVRGTLPLQLGDVVLGATVATDLDLGPGAALFSDPTELYDIAKPPALKMRVCGVLSRSGSPDDDAVFVDVKTTWILEGLAHGHVQVEKLPRELILGRSPEVVAVSPAMIEYNEVTPENIASFHYHGDSAALPLTAILFFPADAKAGTIAKARTNASKTWQMLVPSEVIADLMAFVFRIKALFDRFSALLGVCMVLMTLLVVLLSMRVRAGEMLTLNHIGCSRSMVAKLYAYEILLIASTSVLIAGLATGAVWLWLPNLVRLL